MAFARAVSFSATNLYVLPLSGGPPKRLPASNFSICPPERSSTWPNCPRLRTPPFPAWRYPAMDIACCSSNMIGAAATSSW